MCLIVFLKSWHPKKIWGHGGHQESEQRAARQSTDTGDRPQQDGAARSSGRDKAYGGSRGVRLKLALGNGFGNPPGSDHIRLHHGAVALHLIVDFRASGNTYLRGQSNLLDLVSLDQNRGRREDTPGARIERSPSSYRLDSHIFFDGHLAAAPAVK